METEAFELHCTVILKDKPKIDELLWKTCEWHRHTDDATCIQVRELTGIDTFAIQKQTCHTSMNAAEGKAGLVTSMVKCTIAIRSAKVSDRGRWTCMLKKCQPKDKGGCESEVSSSCKGESSVNVKVIITILQDNNIKYAKLQL
jgi:hypothetical protein